MRGNNLGIAVSWFKKEHGRSGSIDSHDEIDMQPESTFQRQQSVHGGLGKSALKGSSG